MKKSTIAIPFACLALATTSQAVTVALIDFGQSGGNETVSETLSGSTRFWNNVTDANQPVSSAKALVNTANGSSGISLQMSNANTSSAFNNYNGAGISPTEGQAAARFYPTSATQDNMYGYTVSDGGNFSNPTGAVTLVFSGLTTGQAYDFFGMASRSDNSARDTNFSFVGQNTVAFNWDSSSNSDVFQAASVLPDANNKITLTLSPGASNLQSQKFFYLNVLEIATVPEPSSALAGLLGLGLMALRRRR